MILVETYRQKRNEYDYLGRLLSEAGTVWVSHGTDTETGRTIILDGLKLREFKHQCFMLDGEWYLK